MPTAEDAFTLLAPMLCMSRPYMARTVIIPPRGDLDGPAMDQYIVSMEGHRFGYLQCCDLTAWNSGFLLVPVEPGDDGW
jgi:hypothetical protein